jgi:xanthine dehydrogenase accessory factor
LRRVPLSDVLLRERAVTVKGGTSGAAHEAGPGLRDLVVVIKGAGDVATGIAHRLFKANFTRILMTEIGAPLTVRRAVSFSEAVYKREAEVEGVKAELVDSPDLVSAVWGRGHIAVLVDPLWKAVEALKPHVVIDAIMAKRNLGTRKEEAPLVIGVGPGFTAPRDVHVAVESKRGHDLGKVIYHGSTEPHTGIPGSVMGYGVERVLRSSRAGRIRHVKMIGDEVKKGDLILFVGEEPVYGPFDGVLRGLIREIDVEAGEKIGDVDPRGIKGYCYTISDKARAVGGGVLEATLHASNR